MSEFLLDNQGRILVTDTGDPVVAFAQASPTPGGNFYGCMHVWDEPPIPLISISISVVVTIGVGVVIKGWAVDGRSAVAKIEIWGGGWNKVRKLATSIGEGPCEFNWPQSGMVAGENKVMVSFTNVNGDPPRTLSVNVGRP